MAVSSLVSTGLQSPDLNPIEHLWEVEDLKIHLVDGQLTNVVSVRDGLTSIWAKISKEHFLHLLESIPQRMKAILKVKGLKQEAPARWIR